MSKDINSTDITEFQTYLFNNGDNYQSYYLFGTHKIKDTGKTKWRFTVWAPNAQSVSVIGDFNSWNGDGYNLEVNRETGIWYGIFEF